MPNPTALLAEDEPVMRMQLRARLDRLWPGLHICGEARNGQEAITMMERHRPDVLFLDVELSDMSGLDVARHAAGRSHVAYLSAFDAHAAVAFEQGAVDYVLKPFDDARLGLAIERVKQRLGSPTSDAATAPTDSRRDARRRAYLRWIKAPVGNDVRLISVDEVCYFQAGLGYTRVFTEGHEFLIRMSLKELLDQLDPSRFWMIHRSTIVNAHAVSGITRDPRSRLQVKLKSLPDKLAVSEAHERLFKPM